jgi:hypothetical protein
MLTLFLTEALIIMRYILFSCVVWLSFVANAWANAYGLSTVVFDNSVVPAKVIYQSQTSLDISEATAYVPALSSTLYETTSSGTFTISSTGNILSSFNGSTVMSDTRVAYGPKPSAVYRGEAKHHLRIINYIFIPGVVSGWIDSLNYSAAYPTAPWNYVLYQRTFIPAGVPPGGNTPVYPELHIKLQGTYNSVSTPSSIAYAYIDSLGFKGDTQMFKWYDFNYLNQNNEYDPGDVGTPTWIALAPYSRGLVVYPQNTPVRLKARLRFTRPVQPPLTASIRVKAASKSYAVVGTFSNVSVTPTNNVVALPDFELDSSYTFVNKVGWVHDAFNQGVSETFKWEISYSNNGVWLDIGQTPVDIGWIYANPYSLAGGYLFKNYVNTAYDKAYDEVLTMAITACDGDTNRGFMLEHLNTFVKTSGDYDDNVVTNGLAHPWKSVYISGQCSDKAQTLTGMARSMGISVETKYYWGGNSDMKSSWLVSSTPSIKNEYRDGTLRVQRPAIAPNISANELFRFHAVSAWLDPVYGDVYFDPSYGISPTNVDLVQAANLPTTVSPGGCYTGSAANSKRRIVNNPQTMNTAVFIASNEETGSRSLCSYP